MDAGQAEHLAGESEGGGAGERGIAPAAHVAAQLFVGKPADGHGFEIAGIGGGGLAAAFGEEEVDLAAAVVAVGTEVAEAAPTAGAAAGLFEELAGGSATRTFAGMAHAAGEDQADAAVAVVVLVKKRIFAGGIARDDGDIVGIDNLVIVADVAAIGQEDVLAGQPQKRRGIINDAFAEHLPGRHAVGPPGRFHQFPRMRRLRRMAVMAWICSRAGRPNLRSIMLR